MHNSCMGRRQSLLHLRSPSSVHLDPGSLTHEAKIHLHDTQNDKGTGAPCVALNMCLPGPFAPSAAIKNPQCCNSQLRIFTNLIPPGSLFLPGPLGRIPPEGLLSSRTFVLSSAPSLSIALSSHSSASQEEGEKATVDFHSFTSSLAFEFEFLQEEILTEKAQDLLAFAFSWYLKGGQSWLCKLRTQLNSIALNSVTGKEELKREIPIYIRLQEQCQ
ncbi:hypothetical protein BDV59DRAFT_44214 [Aspergillus ambiguus]|uniref:uncharacterized protein n=1 Tax=Aspergillus ambiguus TaxID=176160 RepID=UPI003CCDDFF5